jgi:hypothetical protein
MKLTKIKQVVPSTLEEALERFLLWKKAQGLNIQTLEDYFANSHILVY